MNFQHIMYEAGLIYANDKLDHVSFNSTSHNQLIYKDMNALTNSSVSNIKEHLRK